MHGPLNVKFFIRLLALLQSPLCAVFSLLNSKIRMFVMYPLCRKGGNGWMWPVKESSHCHIFRTPTRLATRFYFASADFSSHHNCGDKASRLKRNGSQQHSPDECI